MPHTLCGVCPYFPYDSWKIKWKLYARMETQMDKKVGNEMDTTVCLGLGLRDMFPT